MIKGPTPNVELLARIQSGDASAEEELVGRYSRQVLSIVTARTRDRDAARDITQEILIAVLQAARDGQIREPEKLAAFIQGAARNLTNNYLRTRARRAECALETFKETGSDSVAEREFQERKQLVQQELRACSVLDQKILLYSLVDGHSLAEVAKRLELSHEAVRARKSRLVKKLLKKFGGLSQK